ncbi:MAG: UDP-N-acetylmuramate--L-alanine ligase [Synechococcales cyanobacterium RU_4_20]|nr:UDP-N-acetylmuramate--L-alanine ligase [Synechococcales cyanobacterium RU_4_20]NJR69983.1 UDP-N-acetylmuramate--L-alanine ligase [Synechococcales cyanobacterium CRU_2_2]
MTQAVDFSGRPFHFIGVGGIGMSAIAQVLVERKLPVSGSDVRHSHITERLQRLGVHIFWGQDGQNLSHFQPTAESLRYEEGFVGGGIATLLQPAIATTFPVQCVDPDYLPQVVCSTAIRKDNLEYQAALELGCPIFHRSDILAALIGISLRSVSVAGTHGKTTTSGMIGHLLTHAKLDPTVVIGGEVNALGGNARLGESDYLVAEADESDGSLVKFQSYLGIITNIELDHPDHYANLEQVVSTFQKFASRCQMVVGCYDCDNVRRNIPLTLSYSLERSSGADYSVDQVEYSGYGTRARIWEKGGCLGELTLNLLGSHNLSNALAAVAVGRHFGLPFGAIAAAIAQYEGAKRRFEYRGHAHDIVFVDDYAHHPSELKVTLAAARLQLKTSTTRLPILPERIVAIFQPHRFSRTQVLMEDFRTCFGDADEVIVCEIYSAGEKDPGLAGGQALADVIAQVHPKVRYCNSLDAVRDYLQATLQPKDLALFMGAGNLNQIIPGLITHFEKNL